MKRLVVLLIAVFMVNATKSYAKRIIPLDSIGVEKRSDQYYVLHKVEGGETLSSIARRYNVGVKDVLATNTTINANALIIGQVIRVPLVKKKSQPTAASKIEFVHHIVRRNETVWSIAKQYNMKVADVKRLNNLSDNELYIGKKLWVYRLKGSGKDKLEDKPEFFINGGNNSGGKTEHTNVSNANTSTTNSEDGKTSKETPWWAYQPIGEKNSKVLQVAHTIQPGETLEKISKEYNVPMEKLVSWNAMTSADHIKAGDRIIVGYEYIDKSTGNITSNIGTNNSVTSVDGSRTEDSAIKTANDDKNRVTVTGSNIPVSKKLTVMGAMIKGSTETVVNKHLALHRTAPTGSYIKVTNPNNGRSTFVRVLGNLQNVDTDKDVIIKLSRSACQSLGLVTEKFSVTLEYNE